MRSARALLLLLLTLCFTSPALAQDLECLRCKKSFREGRFCPDDGAPLIDPSQPRQCPACARVYPVGTSYCKDDGAPLLNQRSRRGAIMEEEASGPVSPYKILIGLAIAGGLGWIAYSFLLKGHSEFLCDSCKFNDARYCSLPQRPNATKCSDYKSRMS